MQYGEGGPTGMKGLQEYAKDLTKENRQAAVFNEAVSRADSARGWAENQAAKKEWAGKSLDEKGSAILWNILTSLGGGLKEDVEMLKADPVGSLKATADAYIVGPEARQRFKQGDYTGAVVQSGLGSWAALPEMQKLTQGKAGLGDLGWLAATYLGGPITKGVKSTKAALGTGSKKAYLDLLSRLPK